MARASDFDETTAKAALPHLDIEIVHRVARAGDAEQISITLRAVPTLEAFGRFLQATTPLGLWLTLVETAWRPWLTLFDPTGALETFARSPIGGRSLSRETRDER
jgi:hypothetical protein